MELDKKIKKEIILSYFFKFLGVVVSFFSVPVLLNFLGKEAYGLWVTMFSMISWFLILDFGMGLGLRNLLTKSIAEKNIHLAKKLIISSYLSIGLFFLLVFVLLNILIEIFDWTNIFNTSLLSLAEIRVILRVLSLGFCLLFVFQLINNLNFATHDSSKVELIKTLRQVVVFVPVLFLSQSENTFHGLIQIVGINSFLPLLVLFLFTCLFFKSNKILLPAIGDYSLAVAKSILTLGGKFFILRLSSILIISVIPFLITKNLGSSDTADYNIGFKLFGIIQMAIGLLLAPYWSAITEKYSMGDSLWIKKRLFYILIWSFIGIVAVLLLRIIFPYIIPYWIGDDIFINYKVINWSLLLVVSFIITEPFLLVLNGMGEIRVQMYHSLIIIVFLIPLSLLLFNFTNLGVGSFIIPPILFRILRSSHAMFQIRILLKSKDES